MRFPSAFLLRCIRDREVPLLTEAGRHGRHSSSNELRPLARHRLRRGSVRDSGEQNLSVIRSKNSCRLHKANGIGESTLFESKKVIFSANLKNEVHFL